jgi:hypothetical protein
MHTILLGTKILVAASIFFVWVVRYENIVTEFKEYGIPAWLRDLTGILKLAFATMLFFGQQDLALPIVGSFGIVALMGCAQAVHIRADTARFRRVPSLVLLMLSAAIGYASLMVGT